MLKVCLCIGRNRGWGGSQGMQRLMSVMVEDCGVEQAQYNLLSSSFHMCTSEQDISTVCQSLGTTAKTSPKV